MTAVRVCRRGAAIEVDGQLWRRADLAPLLGDGGARARRFSAVEVAGDDLVVTLAGGQRERLTAADLARLRARSASLVIDNIGRMATCDGDPGDALGLVDNAALVIGGGEILWAGPAAGLAACGLDLTGAGRLDAGGRLVTPGLIDCHAHPIFAGNRAGEFALRSTGADYQAIAAAGGGIAATVEPTRRADFDELVALAAARAQRALAAGTTTLEAKSGYDLTEDGELRLLEVAGVVDALLPIDLSPTLLGAHVIPPEHREDRAGYVDAVCRMVDRAAADGLATAVDVYCDDGAFTLAETRTILERARAAGLLLRAHVGQFADLGGPELLAELGGLSGDHLEQVSADGIAAMAAQSVAAVMLPGACVQLGMAPPPVAALREAGVALAVATDMNPGTSYAEALPVQMWLATTHYGMTVDEAWLGVTRIAARVLGRHDIGVIARGAAADLVLWDAEQPAEIPYHYGANLVHQVIAGGLALDPRD